MRFQLLLRPLVGALVLVSFGACGDPAETSTTDTSVTGQDVDAPDDVSGEISGEDVAADLHTDPDILQDSTADLETGPDVDPDTTIPDDAMDVSDDTSGDVGPDVVDPCTSIDCGPHGACVADPSTRCACDDGWVPAGLSCTEDLIAAQIANLPASVSTAVTRGGSFQVSLVDAERVGAHTFAVASGGCGMAVIVSTDGNVSWTCPAASVDCEATVTVSQPDGHHDEGILSIACGASTPNLLANAPTSASEHAVYRWVPTCSDPNSLPTSLAVAGTDTCGGALSGGTYSFTPDELGGGTTCRVAVSCSNGELSATAGAQVAIAEVNAPPLLTNLPASASARWGRGGSFTATATDSDLPAQALAYSVASSSCAFVVSVAATTGAVSYTCGAATGACEAQVRVSDGVTNVSAALDITCTNAAPTVSAVAIAPTTAYRNTSLSCTYSYADADADPDASTIAWYIGASPTAVDTGATLASGFSAGDVVRCRVTPSDGVSSGSPGEATVTIGNRTPIVANVAIAPTAAFRDTPLSCSYSYTDADGDADASTIAWYVGNGASPVGTGPTLNSGYGVGAVVRCRVTPNDGLVAGTPVEAVVTIGNRAPTVANVAIAPTTAYRNTALSCTYSYSDGDGDSDASTIAWFIGNGVTPVGTGSTLTSGYKAGDLVRCRVSPSDGIVTGTAAEASVTIGNRAPTVSNVVIAPGTAYRNSALSCTYSYADADGDISASTVAWYLGDSTTPAATGASFAAGSPAGTVVRCRVTPHDGIVAGAVVEKSLTIQNRTPSVSNVAIAPSAVYRGSELSCSYTFSDADGDPDESSIGWYLGAGMIPVATGSTLVAAYPVGTVVKCRVTPHDGVVAGVAVEKSVTIQNRIPTVSGVTVTPTAAYRNTMLTCDYTYTDLDGDADASSIAWYINNGTAPAGTGRTLSSGYVAEDVVRCTVTPHDGVAAGVAVDGTVTIGNRAPTATAATISPATAYRNTPLTISYTFTDPDGDANVSTVAWYIGDATSPAAYGSTLSGGFSAGDVVKCRVTPRDGLAAGVAVERTVTIQNRAATVSNVAIAPTTAYRNTALSCSYSFTDLDGDTDQSTIAWFLNNGVTAIGVGPNLATGYSAGDTVRCRVTPHDGIVAGIAKEVSVAISNRLPVVANVRVSPSAPTQLEETLSCTYAFSDSDGDTDHSTIEWLVERTVVATGPTYAGQLPGDRVACRVAAHDGVAAGNIMTSTEIVAPGDVILAAIGVNHACSVDRGALVCWGNNDYGQLGDGTEVSRFQAAVVPGFDSGVTGVAAGQHHTCALKAGRVYCWGNNHRGQAGATASTTVHEVSPREVPLPGAASHVIAGGAMSCAIVARELYCWGNNLRGQLGDGTVTARHTAGEAIDLPGDVEAATAGDDHACAIVDGAAYCWGDNGTGQLGYDTGAPAETLPLPIPQLDAGVSAIAAGTRHTCAIKNGAAFCWGSNSSGSLGIGTQLTWWYPKAVLGMGSGVTHIAAGAGACAIANRALSCWGPNLSGELGLGTVTTRELSPAQVDGFDVDAARVYLGSSGVACGVQDQSLFCWGRNDKGQLRRGAAELATTPIRIDGSPGFSSLAIGAVHSCGVLSGALYCWGEGTYGRLGIPGTLAQSVPTLVPTMTSGVTSVSVGAEHTCAVRGGAAYCWGRNNFGQLGDNTKIDHLTPTIVPSLDEGVTQVTAMTYSTCALKGGAVLCWGLNSSGQLGNGSLAEKLTPTSVLDVDSQVTSISGQNQHVCAIRAGALLCWGANHSGQLGDNTQVSRSRPTAVTNMSQSVTAVATGVTHSCAIRSGALSCWGRNFYGEAGDSTTVLRTTPVAVVGHSTSVAAVETGNGHTCARRGAVLKCWGRNSEGQLGDGTTDHRTSPVTVSGFSSGAGTLLVLGGLSSCATKGTPAVPYCWGANTKSQLGLIGPFSEYPL